MIFFTKNPNLKKKERCWGGGVGAVSDFFYHKESKSTQFFFLRGRGRGVEGVVWRGGSVARVSEFFLQRIQF